MVPLVVWAKAVADNSTAKVRLNTAIWNSLLLLMNALPEIIRWFARLVCLFETLPESLLQTGFYIIATAIRQ
jgi:hypothetical protein